MCSDVSQSLVLLFVVTVIGTADHQVRSYGSATASRTGVPIMALSGFNIVIIDFADAYELGKRLSRAGATVHIVGRGGALVLARNKRIDAAFITFGVDADTRRFCERLIEFGIGKIIFTAGDAGQQTLEAVSQLGAAPQVSHLKGDHARFYRPELR